MSFFSYLFGTGADKVGKTNINEYKCITRQEVLGLVSPLKVKTLSQKEEKTVEEILWERLKYFHKISLKNKHKYNRKAVSRPSEKRSFLNRNRFLSH